MNFTSRVVLFFALALALANVAQALCRPGEQAWYDANGNEYCSLHEHTSTMWGVGAAVFFLLFTVPCCLVFVWLPHENMKM